MQILAIDCEIQWVHPDGNRHNGGMTTDEAKAFYGGNVSALARALGLDQSSIYSWGPKPPAIRQLQLECITGGKLSAEVSWRGKSKRKTAKARA